MPCDFQEAEERERGGQNFSSKKKQDQKQGTRVENGIIFESSLFSHFTYII